MNIILYNISVSFFLEGVGYDPSDSNSDYSLFQKWLQCYNNPEMDNLIDHDGRTIWFQVHIHLDLLYLYL